MDEETRTTEAKVDRRRRRWAAARKVGWWLVRIATPRAVAWLLDELGLG